jgi:phosphoribosyl 1,2-cyclic phosphodiesterase
MDSQAGLTVCVLGSSSAGNSTLIRNGSTAVLIDCGFSPSYMESALGRHGLGAADLSGVLITHTHSDHVNPWFVKKLLAANIPIHCPSQIEMHLQSAYDDMAAASHRRLLRPLKRGEVEIGEFRIRSFEVPHDSPGGCFGYSVTAEVNGKDRKVSVTTDIARATPPAIQGLSDSDVLVIESNHDVEMLQRSARPVWLKRRIRETGHLSNDECADLLLRVCDNSKTLPASIMLAHVSQECNTNKLARECTGAMLDARGISAIQLLETHPHTSSKHVTLQ